MGEGWEPPGSCSIFWSSCFLYGKKGVTAVISLLIWGANATQMSISNWASSPTKDKKHTERETIFHNTKQMYLTDLFLFTPRHKKGLHMELFLESPAVHTNMLLHRVTKYRHWPNLLANPGKSKSSLNIQFLKTGNSTSSSMLPAPLSAGGLQLLLRASLGWALSLLAVGTAGLVTPGMSGRQQGGVRANGELRQSRRNFRS